MAARDRTTEKLKGFEALERAKEMKFTLADVWHLRLFLAQCRRRTPANQMVVPSYNDAILWSEFTQLAQSLREYLDKATERIIWEEVFKDPGDPAAQ